MLERNDEWARLAPYRPVGKLTAMCEDPRAVVLIAAKSTNAT
jgi:hypothetical protein